MMKARFAGLGAIGALVGLSTGCGFEKSVYDIEMNEAELSAVPYVCDNGREGVGRAWDVSSQQRWTITAGERSDTRIEVPGFFRALLHGYTDVPIETPFVLNGTSSDSGPYQFVDLNSETFDDIGSGTTVQRFFIEGDSLEADRIKGFVDVRTTAVSEDFKNVTCTHWVSFTGRRVD
ncbi:MULTISPECIES: hypothetical protein [Myxococcus]|uniref:Lipoprotein n=1 Tax=Myxococcus llanfairpwllgwyngyllgogerychwyrndrobwllllantysiliogogogochensis TaxID=2590453 RepID=A0A540WP15_9BACT|nr:MULTISPECIES: hypothetical protein [Myxococcus]NTX08022.1 hypothetical protein [Myxococcus sp. CA040A]TQF10772.1 hypothetical protein FJV41_37665 [Myxococcus llanfairpwllgwyngyllgogerychwyrndrobwllllantysiliogogogochensis]